MKIKVDSWYALRDDARAVRYAVFCVEQKIPVELEWDDMDEPSLHAIALNDDGRAIGTGRLLPDGHIGRMAVLAEGRGKGLGGALLETLVDEARRRGLKSVVLNAQTYVEGFYQAHGFAREGEEFIEAEIPHIAMRRALD